MYEMLTGRVPFTGEGFGEILVAHLTETAEAAVGAATRTCRPSSRAIVMHAIEKDRNRRFQTMEEFGVALGDPAAFAASPSAVAKIAKVAAAPTAAVPVVAVDDKSGPRAAVQSQPEAATLVSVKKKADTTLSGAASESAVRDPAPKRAGGRRALLFGGVGVAAAAAAVLTVVKLGGGGATVTPPPVTPPPVIALKPAATVTAPKPPETVEVALKSDPAGAQVVRSDGVVVGVTPVTMKLDKGAPALDVQISLDGYRPEKRTLASDVNRELDVNLLKASGGGKHGSKTTTVAKPTTPGETKPGESKPGESKPAVTKPAEAKPEKPADPDKDFDPRAALAARAAPAARAALAARAATSGPRTSAD